MVAPLVSRSLQALKKRKFLPLTKVSLENEKLSSEKVQSLQHLLKVKSPQNLRKRNKRKTKKV